MNTNEHVVDVVGGITIEQALKKYEPIVHRFVNLAQSNSVCSKEDLIQEGRMAIVVAFRRFDPEKGASLTTWTYHLIKDAIYEYQKHHLSILSGGAYLNSVLKKAGEEASIEEIMEFGVSKQTALASAYIKSSYMTEDIDECTSVIGAEDVETETMYSFNWRPYVTDIEAFAISNFFGFNGPRMTMQEIGEKLGKSRKAVSYLLNKALVKLRRVPGIEEYAHMVR